MYLDHKITIAVANAMQEVEYRLQVLQASKEAKGYNISSLQMNTVYDTNTQNWTVAITAYYWGLLEGVKLKTCTSNNRNIDIALEQSLQELQEFLTHIITTYFYLNGKKVSSNLEVLDIKDIASMAGYDTTLHKDFTGSIKLEQGSELQFDTVKNELRLSREAYMLSIITITII